MIMMMVDDDPVTTTKYQALLEPPSLLNQMLFYCWIVMANLLRQYRKQEN
jgi:hypothetical protein